MLRVRWPRRWPEPTKLTERPTFVTRYFVKVSDIERRTKARIQSRGCGSAFAGVPATPLGTVSGHKRAWTIRGSTYRHKLSTLLELDSGNGIPRASQLRYRGGCGPSEPDHHGGTSCGR